MHFIMNKNIPVVNIEQAIILNSDLAPKSLVIKYISTDKIYKWLSSRALPLTRAHAEKIYQTIGLPRDAYMELIYTTHGLSINDNFWVADESEIGKLRYEDINLYNNSLNKDLYIVALKGEGNFTIQGDIRSAEYTGQGTYPKAFIRHNDGVYMYKSGSIEDITNEIVAGYLAELLGLRSVHYEYKKLQDIDCVVSKIVSGIHINWENAFDITEHINDMYKTILQEFALRAFGRQYSDLAIFDGIILNDDRHMKNWAFEIHPEQGKFMGIAHSYDYNKAFQATAHTMSQLIFDGYKRMNILNAARYAYMNYGTNLNIQRLLDNIEGIPGNLNKYALINRINYIVGNSSDTSKAY